MMLSEIPPVKDVPPPTLTVEEEERIKADLVKKHEMKSFKEAGDLSMKVLLVFKYKYKSTRTLLWGWECQWKFPTFCIRCF